MSTASYTLVWYSTLFKSLELGEMLAHTLSDLALNGLWMALAIGCPCVYTCQPLCGAMCTYDNCNCCMCLSLQSLPYLLVFVLILFFTISLTNFGLMFNKRYESTEEGISPCVSILALHIVLLQQRNTACREGSSLASNLGFPSSFCHLQHGKAEKSWERG